MHLRHNMRLRVDGITRKICIQMGCFVNLLQQEDVNSLKHQGN